MRKLAALLGVVAVLASAVGAASTAGTAVDSGLTGKVLRGPITPVCRADTPCYAPYEGTLVFTRVAAAEAILPSPVRVRTTSRGTYKALLDAGRYRVTTGARSRFGGILRPAVVSVPRKGIRRVNFVVDTGIR